MDKADNRFYREKQPEPEPALDPAKQEIAKAIFVGTENTWPTPGQADCQRVADLVIRGLSNAGFAIVRKVELENLRGRSVDNPEDW